MTGLCKDNWLAWPGLCRKMSLYWLRTQKVQQRKLWAESPNPNPDTAVCSTLPVWPWWSEMNQAAGFSNFPAGQDPYHITAVEQFQINFQIWQTIVLESRCNLFTVNFRRAKNYRDCLMTCHFILKTFRHFSNKDQMTIKIIFVRALNVNMYQHHDYSVQTKSQHHYLGRKGPTLLLMNPL